MTKTGGELLIDCLLEHGATMGFGVPGESYLAALDAMVDRDFRFIICRQEGGAAMMADAQGKVTGRPGICFVTRGPGATNASAGLHIAQQDSTPMIMLVGQIARKDMEREAFQEIDYRKMFGSIAKWVAQVDDAERIPEFVSRAFHTATAGRPGPVVLALPEDMLREEVEARPSKAFEPVESQPGQEEIGRLRDLLEAAERPFVIVGGAGWSQAAAENLARFAEANDLPVGASFRCQDRLDNNHACYAGHVGIGADPALTRQISEADLLLVLGSRLGESTTGGFTLIDIPLPKQKLIHVHPGAEEIGRIYQPTLGINAAMGPTLKALAAMEPVDARGRADWRRQARANFETTQEALGHPGPVQMPQIVRELAEQLGPDVVLCNGAGNFSAWFHRYHRYTRFGTQVAPTSGSMGYGTPAATAVKLLRPEAKVVALAGDGCFLMNGQELATALQYDAKIVILVINNGMYGTIRMHQERDYPSRVSGTELRNPDFAALARAYGAHGERVEQTEDFAPALERAIAADKPALIEILLDPEAITPIKSLSEIRAG